MLTFLMIMCVVSFASMCFAGVISLMDLEDHVPFFNYDWLPYSVASLLFFIVATLAWACILCVMGY